MLVAELTVVFFFFKQRTAYAIRRSLVGSEMCLRARLGAELAANTITKVTTQLLAQLLPKHLLHTAAVLPLIHI